MAVGAFAQRARANFQGCDTGRLLTKAKQEEDDSRHIENDGDDSGYFHGEGSFRIEWHMSLSMPAARGRFDFRRIALPHCIVAGLKNIIAYGLRFTLVQKS